MNNELLASLAAEREARKRPRTPDSTSAKRVKSASVIDLCDSDDDEDDSDEASLALARRLQHNQSSSSEEASMALARKLQAEELLPEACMALARKLQAKELLPFGIPSSGLHVVAPGTPIFFLALKQDADRYRRDCEGPPSARLDYPHRPRRHQTAGEARGTRVEAFASGCILLRCRLPQAAPGAGRPASSRRHSLRQPLERTLDAAALLLAATR